LPRYLHIISFDVPFPANYGGVIDVYYKLVWLHRLGVKITLHCFSYGRKPAPELELLCDKVFYYERQTGFFSNLSRLPYNVKSRRSLALEQNLLSDEHPILFEVLHTCYLLNDSRFKTKRKIYRHSNIEHTYYHELSKSERSLIKKIYLKIEALKLRAFEPVLKFADLILAVNQKDTDYFKTEYPTVKSFYLPSFHSGEVPRIKEGRGDFILFHGNLSVSENYEAAVWLIKDVFSKLNVNCVIAGLNPPLFLQDLVKEFSNIRLMANPDHDQMRDLIQDAHAHMLYTPQPTGLKLKLINALFNGRFLLCNSAMLSGSGVSPGQSILICDSATDYIKQIGVLMSQQFNKNLMEERAAMLKNFDNLINGERLIQLIFE